MKHWLNNSERLVVITNNSCNLNCPGCDTGCDREIGGHHFRRIRWELTLRNWKKILETLGKAAPRIRLHGGETTAMPLPKLMTMIDMAERYRVPVGVLTNGYGMNCLPSKYWRKLDHIATDDHGVNSELVQQINNKAKMFNVKNYAFKNNIYLDMKRSADLSPKTGKPCSMLYKIPAVLQDVFFPCCGPFYNNPGSLKYMREAGWSIHNPAIMQVSADKSSIPGEFWDDCLGHCFANAYDRPEYSILGRVTGRVEKCPV